MVDVVKYIMGGYTRRKFFEAKESIMGIMGYPLERDLKATAHDNRIQNNPITLGAIKDVNIFWFL